MRDAAFIVGVIRKDGGALLGFDVFSEERPTLGTKLFAFTVLRGVGDDFEQGLESLRKQLREPYNEWILEHLVTRGHNTLGLDL